MHHTIRVMGLKSTPHCTSYARVIRGHHKTPVMSRQTSCVIRFERSSSGDALFRDALSRLQETFLKKAPPKENASNFHRWKFQCTLATFFATMMMQLGSLDTIKGSRPGRPASNRLQIASIRRCPISVQIPLLIRQVLDRLCTEPAVPLHCSTALTSDSLALLFMKSVSILKLLSQSKFSYQFWSSLNLALKLH